MGENYLASTPPPSMACPALAAIAYYILQRAIIAHQGRDSLLASASARLKGKLSPMLYFIAYLFLL